MGTEIINIKNLTDIKITKNIENHKIIQVTIVNMFLKKSQLKLRKNIIQIVQVIKNKKAVINMIIKIRNKKAIINMIIKTIKKKRKRSNIQIVQVIQNKCV